jgi:hypothetical protein
MKDFKFPYSALPKIEFQLQFQETNSKWQNDESKFAAHFDNR